MDNNKELLLNNINDLLANMTKANELNATIHQLESDNKKLQYELHNFPTKQTKYVDETREEIRKEAEHKDWLIGKKINKVFVPLIAIISVINAILLFILVNKDGVAEKMQKMNMTFAGNYSMDEIIGVLFPFTLILALFFQLIAIIVSICIAKIDNIGNS